MTTSNPARFLRALIRDLRSNVLNIVYETIDPAEGLGGGLDHQALWGPCTKTGMVRTPS